MKFTEIKVKDLVSFVNSPEFRQMKNLPISSLRARSQSLNPNADANDTALIYAENDQNLLIGYIGILPARVYSSSSFKIYFLSCWWADPEAGRGAAMKLFFKMLEITERKVFFFHMPEKMAAILKAKKTFTFPIPGTGFKGFFKLDFEDWILRKKPNLKQIKPLLFLSSVLFNIPIIIRLQLTKSNLLGSLKFQTNLFSEPDEASFKYFESESSGMTVFRGLKELEWINKNSWLTTDFDSYSSEASRYKFSLLAKDWRQHWIKITGENSIKGLAYLTIRDGVAFLPYIWFRNEDSDEISKSLMNLLIGLKVTAFQTYNPILISSLNKMTNLFIHKRPLQRIRAWPNTMDYLMEKGYILQDGDGDAVFT